MSSPPISVDGVSKWYGKVAGLVRASLEVFPGITGLIGPNGAGKSTLMKLMTGRLRPSLGRVEVYGRDVSRCAGVRIRVGYAPESDTFHEEMRAGQFVYTMARLAGLTRREARVRSAAALEQVGMLELVGKKLRACSRGMRQRVKLAQALAHDPDVIILDEPLSGVDPSGRRALLDVFRSLRDRGKTVVLSSHILHEVEAVTDRIVLVARGEILAAGSLGQIRRLLTDRPLAFRLSSPRRDELAARLLERDLAVELKLGERDHGRAGPAGDGVEDLIVKVRHPERFLEELPDLVLALGSPVERVEMVDASAEAVFEYLVRPAGDD